MAEAKVGIIGGSGLYQIEGMTEAKEIKVKTPFGDPSDAITLGKLEGVKVAFLLRQDTLFGRGMVGHIPFADPYCPVLGDVLYDSARELEIRAHDGGTCIVMGGPRFSTRGGAVRGRC